MPFFHPAWLGIAANAGSLAIFLRTRRRAARLAGKLLTAPESPARKSLLSVFAARTEYRRESGAPAPAGGG